MSKAYQEFYQVQFKTEAGEWEKIIRHMTDLTDQAGNIFSLPYAFELLGREMGCDPEMEHRIVRFVEEVVIAPPTLNSKGDKS